MGHAMRTDDWRYVEWCVMGFGLAKATLTHSGRPACRVHWNPRMDGADWSQLLLGRELYDHSGEGQIQDFDDDFEEENLVDKPQYAAKAAELSAQLRYFFMHTECKKTLC